MLGYRCHLPLVARACTCTCHKFVATISLLITRDTERWVRHLLVPPTTRAACLLPLPQLTQLPQYLLAAGCRIKSLPLQGQRGDIPRRLLPIMIEFSKLLSSEIFCYSCDDIFCHSLQHEIPEKYWGFLIKQFDDADEQEAATFLKKQKASEAIYKNINNDVARRRGCSAELKLIGNWFEKFNLKFYINVYFIYIIFIVYFT